MSPKKFFNLLVVSFPIIYLFHNLEEWLVFRTKAMTIFPILPKSISSILPSNPDELVTIFGMAVVFATIIPAVVSIFLWNRFTAFNSKVLIVAAFVTLINALSHISSAVALRFNSPGLITGIALCIPYVIVSTFFINKQFQISPKQYLLLGLISILVYFLGIITSWLFAMILVNLLSI